MLLALLALQLLGKSGGGVGAIEIKWTPADGEGPAPASKRYRDAMALQQQQQGGGQGMSEEDQLRMMQQMMMQQQGGGQGGPAPPSFLERLLLAGYMAVGGTVAIAQRHPKAAATLSLTAVTGICLRRAARRNGLLLARRPHYWSVWEPPVEFLSGLLEEELPGQVARLLEEEGEGASASSESLQLTAFAGTVEAASAVGEGEGDGGGKQLLVRRRVRLGKGEAAYRKAASLVRTLSLLDAVAAAPGKGPSMGRLYCSERMQEGLFLRPRGGGGGWTILPVAIARRAGRLKHPHSKKKAKKKKKVSGAGVVEEAFEETTLRALSGCAWGRGAALRLAASWRDPGQGMFAVFVVMYWC